MKPPVWSRLLALLWFSCVAPVLAQDTEVIATEGVITVDGVCSDGEWDNAIPVGAFRFKHGNGKLYFLVDRHWDYDSDLLGEKVFMQGTDNDYWLITKEVASFGGASFDINASGSIEAGVDFGYGICYKNLLTSPSPPPDGFKMPLGPEISRLRLRGNDFSYSGCGSGGITAATTVNGFGPSVYTSTRHQIHEVAIPLSEVGGARASYRAHLRLPYPEPWVPGWTTVKLRNSPALTFDEIVSIYEGYPYAFNNGYVDPKRPEDSEVVGSTLDCTSFASVVLQRLKHQLEWRAKMNKTFHYYLGSRLQTDQLKIGKVTFSAANVDRATEVFSSAGLAEKVGLLLADRLLVSDFQMNRGSSKLTAGKLYYFDIQKWATNPAGTGFLKKSILLPGAKKKTPMYVRQGHVGFFRIDEDGAYEQVQYSETYNGLLRGDFRDWLDASARYSTMKFNSKKPGALPKPSNKLQAGHMYLSIFEVPEPEIE